jgi:hypothetical protein
VTWSREDVIWAAGLFEGEGCIALQGRSLIVKLAMTDADIIERAFEVWGVGSVNALKLIPNHKQAYRWQANGGEAYAVLIAMLPWLGSRRKEKARESMLAWISSGWHQTTTKRRNEWREALKNRGDKSIKDLADSLGVPWHTLYLLTRNHIYKRDV